MKRLMYIVGMWMAKKSGMYTVVDINKMSDMAVVRELVIRAADGELSINSKTAEKLLTAVIKSRKNRIVDFIIE